MVKTDWLGRVIGKRETRKAPPGRRTIRRSKTAGASKRAQNKAKKTKK
jgi:hypothetical protein